MVTVLDQNDLGSGHLLRGSVILSQPKPPHRGVVGIKWRGCHSEFFGGVRQDIFKGTLKIIALYSVRQF